MSTIVVAITTTTLFVDAQRIHVNQGAAWAADSPVVTLHPELFSADPHRALGLDIEPPAATKPRRRETPVEQKTAAPGEKHDIKKPRRGGVLGALLGD